MMRTVPNFERKKRGCGFCKDGAGEMHGKVWKVACPFSECPYRVLDKYKTYDEFLKSEDSKILVTEFFSTIASAYELASHHSRNHLYSDGSGRADE